MTLIIGMKCDKAVVLASDGQITTGGHKRLGETKVESIQFINFPALVAQCGSLVMSNRYISILREMASQESPSTPDEVGRIIQNAMYEWRNELRRVHFECSSAELTETLLREGTSLGIIVGFLLNETPHLVTINLHQPLYHLSKQNYEVDGAAEILGRYLLTEHYEPQISLEMGSVVGAHIIGTATQHDLSCGIPVQVMAINRVGKIRLGKREFIPHIVNLSKRRIERLVEVGSIATTETKRARAALLHKFFQQEAIQLMEEVKKIMADLPSPEPWEIEEMTGDHPNTPDDSADRLT